MEVFVKQKLTFGWGVNDVNYTTQSFKVINGKRKQTWICPYYADWRCIIQRCFDNKLHKRLPTYEYCTVTEDWKYLSNFIRWVDSQPNKNWMNCQPDKDLLLSGNKHYSPETVVYISRYLNLFMLDSGKTRGVYMLGVTPTLNNKKNPYQAQCCDPLRLNKKYLGTFPTELEAHKAWQAKKHEYACQLADLQDDPRVADALRQRYAPDKDWSKI